MLRLTLCCLCPIPAICVPVLALSPAEVLVVYNTESSVEAVSHAVADYYASAREIPACNVVPILTSANEYVTESAVLHEYSLGIASPLWNNYLSQPQYAGIRAIVLCYGIPSRISTPGELNCSVDAALTLLGNGNPPAERTWRVMVGNPYMDSTAGTKYGVDFDSFYDSPQNETLMPGWKLRYLVTRLDGYNEPTTTVNGVAIPTCVKDMIDKSVNATPGGNYVIDPDNPGGDWQAAGKLQAAGVTNIISDLDTSVFLMHQPNVIGYFGQHMADGWADNYTTWGRPLNYWHDGGVAIYNTNDGQSFRTHKYIWGALNR
jgi:uncharacterized protein (TIGR03790 family)